MKPLLIRPAVALAVCAAGLHLTGCVLPQNGYRENRSNRPPVEAKLYESIAGIPVHAAGSSLFTPSRVTTIAVVAVAPGDQAPVAHQALYIQPLPARPRYPLPTTFLSPQYAPLTLPANRRSMVETAVEQELLSRGYRLAARSDIDHLLKEMNMQASSLTSDQGAARMGKMVNADAVLVIRLNQAMKVVEQNTGYDNERQSDGGSEVSGIAIDVALRLVVVEPGEALWVGSQNVAGLFKGYFTLDGACADVARNIAERIPRRTPVPEH